MIVKIILIDQVFTRNSQDSSDTFIYEPIEPIEPEPIS